MRNLQQVLHSVHDCKDLAAICYGREGIIRCELESGIAKIVLPDNGVLAEFDVPDLSPELPDMVVNMRYNELEDHICLIMHGGDIVIVHLSPSPDQDPVEIIGTIDERVLAAQWSPDHELLAIATTSCLSLVTQQFESLSKIRVMDEDVRLTSTQVSVGWGRAETQFRGKKTARDPTLPEFVDSGKLSKNDQGQVELSWRGDAAYVCMSRINKNRRILWVYSRDGILESTSEPVDEMLGFISWKPDGSLITAIQHTPSKNQAVMFEKNGLRHGGFELRTDSVVLGLTWNCDSTILAVLYADFLDLWTMGNYHYYLKQRLPLSSPTKIRWHDEDPLKLSWHSRQVWIDLGFQWKCTTHDIFKPNDFGLVAVTDGHLLKLTPFRLANVPPPLEYRQLMLPEVPRDVAISHRGDLIVVLFATCAHVYRWNLIERPVRDPIFVGSSHLLAPAKQHCMQIILNQQERTLVLDSASRIFEVHMDMKSSGIMEEIQDRKAIQSVDVRSIQSCAGGYSFQTWSGRIEAITGDTQSTSLGTIVCPIFEKLAWYINSEGENQKLIGLTASGDLYLQDQILKTKVTSFVLIDNILAYTRSADLNFLDVQEDEARVVDDARTIERGSLLVCACPTVQSIVLQAPRGNLETLFPRHFVLAGIVDLISTKQWAGAWKLSKVHRIDPNFLHDYDPDLFLNSLHDVLAGFQRSAELDIFLTGLKPVDVCETMYSSLARKVAKCPSTFIENKVNTICDAMLVLLEKHYRETHLSSILTAHLCKSPADYRAALLLVADMPQASKDASVTHLCFLADPQLLYKEALALYDLKSALLFAQKSQKDPREYVPFLQKIQVMPDERKRFTLDDHLGKYSTAIRSLLELEDAWEECTTYIERHTLWKVALETVRYRPNRYHQLLAMYAVHLLDIQDFGNAGYAFEQVEDYTQAALAFELAGSWNEALHNSNLANMPIDDIATRLKDQLVDQARYAEAATVAQYHLHDVDTAIVLYCRAYKFSDAILLAGTRERIMSVVRPAVVEAFSQSSELISEMRAQLSKQVPRLQEIRIKRELNPLDFLDQDTAEDAPDNVSLADTQGSTNASFFTRYTGATAMTTQSKKSSKARRRQERQRAKGKKGTIWEEEYLVNSIHRMIDRLNSDMKDIKNLIIALVRCGLRENATELQNSTINLTSELRVRMDEVFQVSDDLPQQLQRPVVARPQLPELQPFDLC